MSRARLAAIAAGVSVAALVFFLWPRREPDAATIIHRKVIQMARAAEQRDAAAIMEEISEQFRAGQLGGRDQVKGLVLAQVMRGAWVRVFVVSVNVTLQGTDEADMVGKFVLGRSEASKAEDLGKDSSLSARRIEARWKREADGEWRVISASQRELTPAEMLP